MPEPNSTESTQQRPLNFADAEEARGIFGTTRLQLAGGLQAVGNRLCGYGPWGHFPRRCDCKYGGTGVGEDTGCPEVGVAFMMVLAMTPTEYRRIAKRAGISLDV